MAPHLYHRVGQTSGRSLSAAATDSVPPLGAGDAEESRVVMGGFFRAPIRRSDAIRGALVEMACAGLAAQALSIFCCPSYSRCCSWSLVGALPIDDALDEFVWALDGVAPPGRCRQPRPGRL
jgi:hypothetical protein